MSGEYEEYLPYGSTAWWLFDSSRGVSESRYQYTGMERDEETRLDCMGARYFAPWLARWVSRDPQRDQLAYAYCGNSPLVRTDRSGKSWLLLLDLTGDTEPAPEPTSPTAAKPALPPLAPSDPYDIAPWAPSISAPHGLSRGPTQLEQWRLDHPGAPLSAVPDELWAKHNATVKTFDAFVKYANGEGPAPVLRSSRGSIDPLTTDAFTREITDNLSSTAGVIYLRLNLTTGRFYVGQAKDPKNFEVRQEKESAQNLNAEYTFWILDRLPEEDLDQREEDYIRALGGPGGQVWQYGLTENKRHQQSEENYEGEFLALPGEVQVRMDLSSVPNVLFLPFAEGDTIPFGLETSAD